MVATTEPKHQRGRMDVAYTMGFVRTRITACHFPSPGKAGRSCEERSSGFEGIVVDVVVVEVSATGTVVVEVVVVDVVVEVTTVATELSRGHDDVAAVGRICSGLIFSGTDVLVDDWLGVVASVVEVCAAVSGMIASARESAGATAGGSL
jgi:hypothetical protein